MLTVCLLAAGLATIAQEKGIDFIENKPWKEVLQLSAEKKKLIFLDCYTTWCGPCKAMAKDVFPLPEVGEFMNANFVNVKQDMEKGEGVDLNKKYKKFIPGYPTYLIINAEGQVVHQVSGYNAAEKFIAKMKDGLSEKSWMAMAAKYEKGQRDWLFIQHYFIALEDAFQKDPIEQLKKDMLPQLTFQSISTDSSAYRIFRKYWSDANAPLFSELLAAPNVQRKFKDPGREVNEWAGRLFKREVDVHVKNSQAGSKLDTASAQLLLRRIAKTEVYSRENMIALLRISMAASQQQHQQFLSLVQYAKTFGMLRYDESNLSTWAKVLAEKTTDKTLLKQYLAMTEVREDNKFLTPDQLKNYAFLLQKTGNKEKAAAMNKKAEEVAAEIKEKFKAMFDKK